jgi:hypothetical protein
MTMQVEFECFKKLTILGKSNPCMCEVWKIFSAKELFYKISFTIIEVEYKLFLLEYISLKLFYWEKIGPGQISPKRW